MAMHSAAMPLPTEATVTIVSRDHGVVRAQFECPAQRSTTSEPSTITDTADPTSGGPPPGRASNNEAYASCTGLNAGSHVPEISTVMPSACRRCSQEHGTSDVVPLEEVLGLAFEADLALLEEDGTIAQLHGDVEALLDEHHGDALLMDLAHDLEELSDDDRRQPERELVDAEHPRLEQECLGQRALRVHDAGERARL